MKFKLSYKIKYKIRAFINKIVYFLNPHWSERRKKHRSEQRHILQNNERGIYGLIIYKYDQGVYWDYSKGVLVKYNTWIDFLNDRYQVVAEVKRNYGHFPFGWIEHSNGNLYLLCGSNYHGGFTVVNAETGKVTDYVPDREKGSYVQFFCWYDFEWYDKHTNKLELSGCYWGAPEEKHIYDFSNPERPPYELLEVIEEDYDDCEDDDYE